MEPSCAKTADIEIVLSRKEIFLSIRECLNANASAVFEKIAEVLSNKLQCSYTLPDDVKPSISRLLFDFRTKWQQVQRKEERFFDKYGEWLSVLVPLNSQIVEETSKKTALGRPSTEFASSSDRSKRRKTKYIRSQHSVEELTFATHMSLRASGKLDAAKVVKDVTGASPTKAQRYRRSMGFSLESTLSIDSALSFMIEHKLSKNQYQGIRQISRENNCKLYPSYHKVLEAKQKCYPPKSSIVITESSAEVKLQFLLDHTVERILMSQMEVIKSLNSESIRSLDLICKWGCDGSSGHSMYKQKFSDDYGKQSDSNMFFTSLVPLQLKSVQQGTGKEIIVWKNPRPSSSRFCRPLKLQFLHENTESTIIEVDSIKKQESELVPFTTIKDGKEISISYKLGFTMIDGKICNAITSTSSAQRCYICRATSKEFNNIDLILQKEVNTDNLQFGLSTLHAWIRLFECCLHISYKLDIKKWQAQSAEDKEKVRSRKQNIQKGFRLQLGLIVDQPKPGFGSTNDGNTARRFFQNATVSASITGVDENLIKQFHVILQAISSGHEINSSKFQQYSLQTARKFVDLYPWYYMPTTVHKILIHSTLIISSSLLPIGQMSEEAQESFNKHIKRFREDFSRKCSRTKTMEDVFLRLLVASDPFISSLRKLPQKKLKSLSPETVQLLIPPPINFDDSDILTAESTDYNTDDSSD